MHLPLVGSPGNWLALALALLSFAGFIDGSIHNSEGEAESSDYSPYHPFLAHGRRGAAMLARRQQLRELGNQQARLAPRTNRLIDTRRQRDDERQ